MVMNMESWNFGEITNNDIYIYILIGKRAIDILKSQKRLHQVRRKYTCAHQRKNKQHKNPHLIGNLTNR